MPSENQPPSTMTATFLENLNRQNGGTQLASNKEYFQQLLRELLPSGKGDKEPGDNASSNSPPLIENVALNFGIIKAITDAGLMTLLQDDPFASFDMLISQAKDCLALIQLTFQRTPRVLLFQPGLTTGSKFD